MSKLKTYYPSDNYAEDGTINDDQKTEEDNKFTM